MQPICYAAEFSAQIIVNIQSLGGRVRIGSQPMDPTLQTYAISPNQVKYFKPTRNSCTAQPVPTFVQG